LGLSPSSAAASKRSLEAHSGFLKSLRLINLKKECWHNTVTTARIETGGALLKTECLELSSFGLL
jgi:hypothetical protein